MPVAKRHSPTHMQGQDSEFKCEMKQFTAGHAPSVISEKAHALRAA